MELLIVVAIIAILAGLALATLAGATEQAREQRTRAIIAKLDQLISEKWESYRTRAVPVRMLAGSSPTQTAQTRLYALRELMRLEMPERISDLCVAAEITDLSADNKLDAISAYDATRATLVTIPSVTRTYKRKAQMAIALGKAWSTAHQGSECLYLILSTIRDGDKSGLDYFTREEIDDTDDDGMMEILDGWGRPIEFLRWAPGYIVQNGAVTLQTSDYTVAPDPFDPLKVDPRWSDMNTAQNPYALKPLIFSAGADKAYDVNVGSAVFATSTPPNDPYYITTPQIGIPADTNSDSVVGTGDNITNHFQETP